MAWPSVQATDVEICLPSDLPKMKEEQMMLYEELHFVKKTTKDRKVISSHSDQDAYYDIKCILGWIQKSCLFQTLFLVVSTITVRVKKCFGR